MQFPELELSLEQQLVEEVPGAARGTPARVKWLAHRFSLYASRLAGFAAAVSEPVGGLRESDLFRAVEAGAAALERELSTSGAQGELAAGWKDVVAALNELRSDFTQARTATLSTQADRWRSQILSGE